MRNLLRAEGSEADFGIRVRHCRASPQGMARQAECPAAAAHRKAVRVLDLL